MQKTVFFALLSLVAVYAAPSQSPQLFESRGLLNENQTLFGTFIEGTAVDASGAAYAVNFGNATERNRIGRLDSRGQTLDFEFEEKSQFNGIRVVCDDLKSTRVYLAADAGNKRVIKVTRRGNGKPEGTVFCGDPAMLQGVPNDLSVDFLNGRIYLSGQAFNENTVAADGEIWMCDRNGVAVKLSDENLVRGRTNGIELSLDGTKLFVSEAINKNFAPIANKILVFDVLGNGRLANRRVFFDFESDGTQGVDIDGMRLDVDGNLYVTRNGGGEVVVFSPSGTIVKRVKLVLTKFPTNIELAGSTGRTAVVVGRCPDVGFGEGVGCVETFRVPVAGRAFTELRRRRNERCLWL